MYSKENRHPALIYVLAASHSGSTLTAMLLNSHPDICTAGELKIGSLGDAEHYRCSCRQLLCECRFWQEVSAQMAARGHEFNVMNAQTGFSEISSALGRKLLAPLHRGALLEAFRDIGLSISPTWRKERSNWEARNRSLIESVASVAGARYVVDSSKTAVRLKFLKRISGLTVKVVRLLRDGRAVSLTYMDSDNFADARDPTLRGGGTGKSRSDRLTMEEAASRWYRSNIEADNVFATVPKADRVTISYEQLCTDTDGVLASIQSKLSLRPDCGYRSFRQKAHHIIGNGMRLDDSNEIRLDDRWRDVLSESDLGRFDKVGGDLNRRYGYNK